MTYLESVQLLRDIESKYDVSSVKFKNVQIWPFIRIKLFERISGADTNLKPSKKSGIRIVLSTLFYYNPFKYFKKSKTWLFSSFERRKQIGDRAVMRISGAIVDIEPETLVIEKPTDYQCSTPRNLVREANIVSESWILLFVHFIAFFLKLFRLKINREDVIKRILEENGLSFDYKTEIKLLYAQKKTMDYLLRIFHKPKKVFIECPYPVMGYIWSMHHHNIKVTELQHGVLNNLHYAYNSLYHSNEFYPDRMCVFGDVEFKYLTGEQCHYCKDIVRTGLYFLEVADKFFVSDVFSIYREDYKHVVLVAGQTGYEKQLVEFINVIALEAKDCIFIYVPRSLEEQFVFNRNNIVFQPGINIYEYMKWCDIHLTISSTTCLECQYFKKPTVFYDYEGRSSNYYRNVLNEDNGVYYINDCNGFTNALRSVDNNKDLFTYKEIFSHDTMDVFRRLVLE